MHVQSLPNHHVWRHSQDGYQPAIVHEMSLRACGSGVGDKVTTVDSVPSLSFHLLLRNTYLNNVV